MGGGEVLWVLEWSDGDRARRVSRAKVEGCGSEVLYFTYVGYNRTQPLLIISA